VTTLERAVCNPIVTPDMIPYARASGAFNPGAVVCHRTDRVAILVRVFEEESRRSSIAMAVSRDGTTIDEIWDRPALAREEPYEEWGIEDPRITFLAAEERYAITYTGYSAAGPRVCLVTTDDILDPYRYRRHGPRIDGDNKNTVVFPEKVHGRYAILHRPMPNIVYAEVDALEREWHGAGDIVLGPAPGTWRSARVGAGAPPIRTPLGWLLAFHGATTIEEGNVYSMGWCVLDRDEPSRVLYVSPDPALAPTASYETCAGPIPQVDMANFRSGVRVVFPEGLVERGSDLVLYYGAADVSVGAARVDKGALLDSLADAIARG